MRKGDFIKDVPGKQYGGAYWNTYDYRITISFDWENDTYALVVADVLGNVVKSIEFTEDHADRLVALVGTDEAADDEGLGLTRELHWRLGDDFNEVDLTMVTLEEIVEWLEGDNND